MSVHRWHEDAEKKWDSYASQWAKNSRDMWDNGSRKKVIPFFVEHIPAGGKVSDLGCGDGYGSLLLARSGYQVVGLDISSEMIETANQKAAVHEQLSFIRGDLVKLPFSDGQFDAIMAINSIEWTESPLLALHEIRRIVKPGGYACFGILAPTAAPRLNNSYRRLYGEKVIMNSMQPWEFAQLATENGWKLVADAGVEKRGVDFVRLAYLSKELQQAVSFMWLFILKKETRGGEND
ncbi:class I SAM-dependent methyltransferase [Peribacillus cavernae]|uniref:Class I SAM-dependent methyltransferase n=1 Tax=Peribacillus cavernae TaxID=1674310 RepID=A0A3S0U106_9BACI|nr:class I SAM-dependent methyltransferase [Peribacillus cavernae]MDQ0217995.1 ubiquinone/menaquinone biosynthesis C-methylase UbiE [Peribacillus cavernae]RUQ28957.1 class I SAM-dependent methyltransferase [Peribacillus cavernae]